MKKELNKGVTLIALIITIIVLLILAGITLAMVMGDNGIIKKAQDAKTITNQVQDDEQNQLKDFENEMNSYLTRKNNNTNSNIMFSIDGDINNECTLNSNKWTMTSGTGLKLDTTDKGTHYANIQFSVNESGRYLFYMNCSRNDQDNLVDPAVHYGISDSAITTFTSYNIVDNKEVGILNLQSGKNYYIGAVDTLDYNYSGYSRVEFKTIVILRID